MIFYEKYGENSSKPLVLLHSGGMAGVEWEPQIATLSASFQLLVPDLPGHGQSKLADNQVLSISLMADAVIAMMTRENIDHAHLVGSSMGGAVALWIALKKPQYVNKLVLYRMGYSKNTETFNQTKAMSDPEYWRQYGMHRWLSNIHRPQGGENAWETVIANVSRVLDPATSEHNHSLADLAQLSAETLLIAGDRDPLIPLPTLLTMLETIPRAALWVMPNASHITASNTWRAESFALELIRFLR